MKKKSMQMQYVYSLKKKKKLERFGWVCHLSNVLYAGNRYWIAIKKSEGAKSLHESNVKT